MHQIQNGSEHFWRSEYPIWESVKTFSRFSPEGVSVFINIIAAEAIGNCESCGFHIKIKLFDMPNTEPYIAPTLPPTEDSSLCCWHMGSSSRSTLLTASTAHGSLP